MPNCFSFFFSEPGQLVGYNCPGGNIHALYCTVHLGLVFPILPIQLENSTNLVFILNIDSLLWQYGLARLILQTSFPLHFSDPSRKHSGKVKPTGSITNLILRTICRMLLHPDAKLTAGIEIEEMIYDSTEFSMLNPRGEFHRLSLKRQAMRDRILHVRTTVPPA